MLGNICISANANIVRRLYLKHEVCFEVLMLENISISSNATIVRRLYLAHVRLHSNVKTMTGAYSRDIVSKFQVRLSKLR